MQWAFFALIGLLSGFLGGLLGIGGGSVIVPALLFLLPVLGIQGADLPQVAIASSLAIIIPSSLSSARTHAQCRAVDWHALARLAPGVLAGSAAGTVLAAAIGGRLLLATFIAFATFAIVRLLRPARTDVSAQEGAPALPGPAVLSLAGAGIGLMSSMVGVGGGILSVPFLAGYIPLRRAIGTAAALGLPLAIAGMLGYMAAGHSQACGSSCLGYVYLPAVLATSLAAVASAPFGARLAHRWPVPRLKQAFAALLAIVIADLALRLARDVAENWLA